MNQSNKSQGSCDKFLDSPSRGLDIVGIYILPLACFIADYMVEGIVSSFYPLSVWTFAAAGMITFAISFQGRSIETQAIIKAILITTGLGSLGIGVILTPFSIIGLQVFGIGLLGFVPYLTAYRLFFRAAQMPKKGYLFTALGFFIVLIPLLGMLTIETLGHLQSQDRFFRALRILGGLARY